LYKFRKWGKKDKKIGNIILISILFALSAYSYHSARVAVPAFLFLMTLDPIKLFLKRNFNLYFKEVWKQRLFGLYPLILFILLILPVFLANKSSLVLTRFKQENLFARYFPFAPKELITTENVWLNWQSNPIYYLTGLLTGHILSYISPLNLSARVYHWVKGSIQYIPTFSMFGWLDSLILLIGLIWVIKNLKISIKNRFLIYWIIAGAAPAAVTWNWFHPLRSLNLYPALDIIIALGIVLIYKFINNLKFKKIIYSGLTLIILISSVYVVLNEYNYSVWVNHGEFQPGGFKEGMQILKNMQDNYDQIIIDSPHAQSYIFFLFYQSFPPEIIQKYSEIRPKPGVEGDLTFNFYKYKFEKFDWPKQRNYKNTLFWVSHDVFKEEIENTPGAKLILVKNAVKTDGAAIITKD
jgi:hypothetical protein